jgi:hypothetical protein
MTDTSTNEGPDLSGTKYTLPQLLAKVRALLDKADSTTFPAEADALRDAAQALMTKYRLDAAMVADVQNNKVAGIVWRTMDVCAFGEFANYYRTLFAAIMAHFDCRAVFRFNGSVYEAHMVGYEADLAFVELLYTSAKLAFSERMEPRYDPTKSQQVNAYLMRKAGMEGNRIARVIFGPDFKPSDRPKVRRWYKIEAERRGEDTSALLGQGNMMSTYRTSYADGFVNELYLRLRRMKREHAEDQGGGLVLASARDNVNEAYYAEYPNHRPQAANVGRLSTGHETCEKCAKAKSGYCKEHRYLKPSQAQGKAKPTNWRAFDAGTRAAGEVDLGTRGRVGGSTPSLPQ